MAFAQPKKTEPEELVDVHLTIRGKMDPRRLKLLKETLADQDVIITEGNPPSLPSSQQTLLGLLVAAGGTLTTTELAAQSGFTANTVRPLMARLVASGLVERDPGISGPRIWKVTEKGRTSVSD